jgi:hypothetical protein
MSSLGSAPFEPEKPRHHQPPTGSLGSSSFQNVTPFPISNDILFNELKNHFVIDSRCSFVYSDNHSLFVRCPLPEWAKKA